MQPLITDLWMNDLRKGGNERRVKHYYISEVFKMTSRILTAVLHKEKDLYVAECPEVGTVSQGHTVEEAVANLKEATELYLEEFPMPEVSRPLMTTFEAAVYG